MSDHMINAQGHLVPIEIVKPEDKLENDLVLSLFNDAIVIRSRLSNFKSQALVDVEAFLELLSEKYNSKKGGKKGNVTLTSYDGLTRIQVSVADYIQFGAQLQIARDLIDECIQEWSEGVNGNIKVIIDQAFSQGKGGRFNTQAILGLRRLNIKDDKWSQAMDAISDSVKITSSKEYIRFYSRSNTEADWDAVSLDIAKA